MSRVKFAGIAKEKPLLLILAILYRLYVDINNILGGRINGKFQKKKRTRTKADRMQDCTLTSGRK